MQKVNQGHRLRETWEVEDAVASVNQSVAIARQYHQLTAQNVSAFSLEIDRTRQKLQYAMSEIKRLERLQSDTRNPCMACGVLSAIVSSLVMALVTSSFNLPQKTVMQTQSFEPMQSAIVRTVQPAQKPQLRKMKTSKAQRRG